MTKQMSLSEKSAIADEFISRTNPYEKKEQSISMDLRAYADYVSKNNLKPSDITDKIMMQFVTVTKEKKQ